MRAYIDAVLSEGAEVYISVKVKKKAEYRIFIREMPDGKGEIGAIIQCPTIQVAQKVEGHLVGKGWRVGENESPPPRDL